MKTRIQKWGNSLALRIPRSFAEEVGIENETDVDLTLEDEKMFRGTLRDIAARQFSWLSVMVVTCQGI